MGKKSSRKKIKYNLQNNLQNEKTKTSAIILGIIFGISIVGIIFIICIEMLRFICYFRAKLNETSNLIFVTPGSLTAAVSPIVFLMFASIAAVPISVYVKSQKNNRDFFNEFMKVKNNSGFMKRRKDIIMIIIIFFGFFNICVDYSIIYKDRIFHRSIINIFGKYYRYSDIKEVNIYNGKNILTYYLIMKDGTKIDLTSIESNSKFIPEVESHIDSEVPHTIDKIYSSALNKIPQYISEKFKITD
jgi:hypothetical protein